MGDPKAYPLSNRTCHMSYVTYQCVDNEAMKLCHNYNQQTIHSIVPSQISIKW